MVSQHTALQVDVVFTALRVISNNIAKMGNLRAYQEQLSDDNVPYRVWLAKQPKLLIDTWGGRHFQYDGMTRTVWSMGLLGEAFWYVIARDGKATSFGLPTALEVLHPAYMEVTVGDDGEKVYKYGPANKQRILDPADVIHIPGKAMPAAKRALNPITYAGVSIALAMAAYEFGSTWFSQGASPDFILSTDTKLGQAEVDRIASKFLVEHSGLSSSHIPLVLDNGLKAEKVMTSPDESQYLNTLEYSRSVIFSWFGIPESMSGNALQRQTPQPPGSMQEESMRFLQHTLSGFIVPLEEAMSSLLPADVGAAFDEGKLARPNAAALADEIMALRQTQSMAINEVRTRKLGLPPVPGGDDVLAPLASNTAPSDTAKPDPATPAPKDQGS